jgi:hypothetical protein
LTTSHDRPQRQSLALLALLTSAVVAVTRGSDFFSLWDSMLGLIIVLVAAAYRHEVGPDRTYRAAFALIVGTGMMFIVGPFLESAIYAVKGTLRYDGPFLQTPDKMIYDGIFVGVWALFAFVIYLLLHRRPRE